MLLERNKNTDRHVTLAISGTGTVANEAFKLLEPTLEELGQNVDFLSLEPDILEDRGELIRTAESKVAGYDNVTLLGISLGGLVAYSIASHPEWTHDTDLIMANTPYGSEHLNDREKRLLRLLRDKPTIGERAVNLYSSLREGSRDRLENREHDSAYQSDMDAREKVPPRTISAQLRYLANYSFNGLSLPSSTQVAHIVSLVDRIVPRTNINQWTAHHQERDQAFHTIDIDAEHADLTAQPEPWRNALQIAYQKLRRS